MANGGSVLVIEDESYVRAVLEYNLRMEEFEVYFAEDGLSGVELALQKKPGLILLDWMLPGMDGLEVLAKLKSHEETKDIPVLMLTAKGRMDDVALALGAGADDYITKPFNPEKLGRVLKKKLEYAKVRRKRDRRREKARTGGLCSAPC